MYSLALDRQYIYTQILYSCRRPIVVWQVDL